MPSEPKGTHQVFELTVRYGRTREELDAKATPFLNYDPEARYWQKEGPPFLAHAERPTVPAGLRRVRLILKRFTFAETHANAALLDPVAVERFLRIWKAERKLVSGTLDELVALADAFDAWHLWYEELPQAYTGTGIVAQGTSVISRHGNATFHPWLRNDSLRDERTGRVGTYATSLGIASAKQVHENPMSRALLFLDTTSVPGWPT